MKDNHATNLPPGAGFDRDAFTALFDGIYEHSPWVAQEIFDNNHTDDSGDIGVLAQRMAAIVDGAGYEKQLVLLRAHPDLAGRLALQGELTEASTDEQKSAGLDQCTPEELVQFQSLNKKYTDKFGFPFILAVSGKNRAQILENFETRVENSPKEEFTTALREVHKIARIRLEKLSNE